MYLVTAKTKATAQDFPGSTVEWAVGQTREVHDSLIQEFKNNPAAWTVSGGATTSTLTATSSAQGVEYSVPATPTVVRDLSRNIPRGPLSRDLAPDYDTPVVTEAASSGYSGTVIDRLDARITCWGGTKIIQDPSGFGQIGNFSSTSSQELHAPFFMGFGYDGIALVIRCGVPSGKTKWAMWVNGKRTSADYYTAVSGVRDITITFPDARAREIVICSTWGAHKITLDNATRTFWKVSRDMGRRAVFVTDSWGAATGPHLDGWAYKLGFLLGYSDIHISAQGGTGYYNNNSGTGARRNFADRFVDEVAQTKASDIFVGGSINDLSGVISGVDRALVVAKKRAFFEQCKTLMPASRVFVFGNQFVRPDGEIGVTDAMGDANDAETVSAATDYGYSVISAKGWLTGTGKSGTATGDGNRDVHRSSDGDHLVVGAGYAYWAQRLAAEIRKTIS